MVTPKALALKDALHRAGGGRASAVQVGDLASQMGVSRREVQELAAELVECGVLVGSTCTKPAGLFLILDETDLAEGTAHIRSRALSSLRRVSLVRKAATEQFGRETVGRLFDLGEVERAS